MKLLSVGGIALCGATTCVVASALLGFLAWREVRDICREIKRSAT